MKQNSKGFWKLVRQKTKVNTGITDLVVDGKTVTSDKEKAELQFRFHHRKPWEYSSGNYQSRYSTGRTINY